jgi:hypothetical protein
VVDGEDVIADFEISDYIYNMEPSSANPAWTTILPAIKGYFV